MEHLKPRESTKKREFINYTLNELRVESPYGNGFPLHMKQKWLSILAGSCFISSLWLFLKYPSFVDEELAYPPI